MEEVWREIPGYEGLYEVSNYGRVKSLNYNKTGKEKILACSVSGAGYPCVGLSNNAKRKTHYIHRIEMQAFVPNNSNMTDINHKDENKHNNFIFVNPDGSVDPDKSNLEWCTHLFNCNHGKRNQVVAEKNTNGKKSKAIIQYSLSGDFIKEWPSQKQAERELGIFHNSISACCKGKLKQTGCFKWAYKN